jgi:heme/copper-type cytochrome/quinol oxidase subunit 2
MEVFMQTQQTAPGTFSQQSVSVGEWMLTLFLCAIPIVGIVMLFVWAFGSSANPNKANWAKAALIWMAIIFVLYLIIFIIFGAALLSSR